MNITWEQITPTLVGVTVSGIWALLSQRGRQAFEKRQAADQRIAQQALEALKTELTFDAEVGRQVAIKKTEALLRVAAHVRLLVECVYSLSLDYTPSDRDAAMREYWRLFRDTFLFLNDDDIATLQAFGEEVNRAIVARAVENIGGANVDHDALLDKCGEERKRLFKMLRDHLGLAEPIKGTSALARVLP